MTPPERAGSPLGVGPGTRGLLIGLDVGTSATKALAYDPETGRAVAHAKHPTPVRHPTADRTEHDPEALWQTAAACLAQIVREVSGRPLAGLAIASFAEAGLPVDDAFRPLYPIIPWFDLRSEPQAAWLDAAMDRERLHSITGQRVSPSFGATKWLWICEHHPDLATRTAFWLSAPDYLLFRLCGAIVTDHTIASRTLLFDQRSLDWSPELLHLAGLRREQLPEPRPSGTFAGSLTEAAAKITGLPVGLPCILGGHDHLCAALATGANRPGGLVDSSGTAQAVLAVLPGFHTGPLAAAGGFACYRHVAPDAYVLKAGLKSAGGAVAWLAQLLSGSGADLAAPNYEVLEREAAAGLGQAAGPLWLPHLIGSGTPEGDRFSMAAAVGLRPEHTRGDLFRGLLESLALWLRHNVEVLKVLTASEPQEVVLLGGLTRLPLLSQIKADCMALPVIVPELPEAAATGAALLAGIGSGAIADVAAACAAVHAGRRVFLPDPRRVDQYARLYETYTGLYGALSPIHHQLHG